jgi:hypothetical protein
MRLIALLKLCQQVVYMLQELSNQQVEKALAWLASPVLEPPPQELEQLSQVEWYLLNQLLQSLLLEKQSQLLQ